MKHIVTFLLMLMLFGCDSGTQWRDGNYQMMWIDTPELSLKLNVGKGALVERVAADIVGVGSNSAYIVVRQRNVTSKQIAYFYLEKSKDSEQKNATEVTQGPFEENAFIEISKKLGLPTITKTFHY